MTNEKAIEILEVAKAEIEWEYPLDYQMALDMAIASLKAQSDSNKCDTCIYKFETDGSNCYECVKGIQDNYEESQ